MNTLILGATGTTGSAVTRTLAADGAAVRILTRKAENAATLPAGIDVRVGDLTQPTELGPVFDGIDALFLLNAVSPTETQEGLTALEWARIKGVKKIVYLSVHYVERAPHIPHFGGKVAIELALKASGLDYTILQPNNFYQNDYWFKEALLGYGLYPQPIGEAGIDRVDVRDIVDAAVRSLAPGAQKNRTYILAGPESLTGTGTAAVYATALGKPVRYMGDDLEAWEQMFLQYMPPWMVFDFKMMYRYFQAHGLKISPAEMEDFQTLLGHPPRRFDDFVRETVAGWQ